MKALVGFATGLVVLAAAALMFVSCGVDNGRPNRTTQHGGEGKFDVVQVQVKDRSVSCIEVVYDDGDQGHHIALSCDWGG